MSQYPVEAFSALDRLNSWVRSPSARNWFRSPRHAIYDWKIHLIRDAIDKGEAKLSAVCFTATCNHCGGTKQYIDSGGYKWPHCRRCRSTGITPLLFVVSEMYGLKWHTPRDKAWELRLPENFFDSAPESTDWAPNMPGTDMETWEVAACLNILEPAMPKPGRHSVYDRSQYFGEVDHAKYRLYLGRSEVVCQLCGHTSTEERDGINHHVSRAYIEWSAWGCEGCRATLGTAIYSKFPVPAINHPEIITWLARRGMQEAAAA